MTGRSLVAVGLSGTLRHLSHFDDIRALLQTLRRPFSRALSMWGKGLRLSPERVSSLKGLLSRSRLFKGLEHGIMSAAAALIAYFPAEVLGLPQSFWGAITAIAVVQTEYAATRTTALDQFTGAAIGGAIGVCIDLAIGQHLWSYAAAVIMAITLCWLLNVASAARLSGSTATIIMLVPHTESPEIMMLSRVSEVAWGVCVAISIVWIFSRLTKPRAAPRNSSETGIEPSEVKPR